jgi:hypothetical protein
MVAGTRPTLCDVPPSPVAQQLPMQSNDQQLLKKHKIFRVRRASILRAGKQLSAGTMHDEHLRTGPTYYAIPSLEPHI